MSIFQPCENGVGMLQSQDCAGMMRCLSPPITAMPSMPMRMSFARHARDSQRRCRGTGSRQIIQTHAGHSLPVFRNRVPLPAIDVIGMELRQILHGGAGGREDGNHVLEGVSGLNFDIVRPQYVALPIE